MFALERQKLILEMLKNDGAVTVSNLSSVFSVTEKPSGATSKNWKNRKRSDGLTAEPFLLKREPMSFRLKKENPKMSRRKKCLPKRLAI